MSEVPLPRTWRPLGVRLVAVFAGVTLLVISVAGWFALGATSRSHFTLSQRLTLVGLGLLVAAVLHGLARCRVTATRAGLRVVNGYRDRTFAWAQVLAVHLPQGAPWVTLDLADGTSVIALGIQSSDGDRAVTAVRELRALIAEHSGTPGTTA